MLYDTKFIQSIRTPETIGICCKECGNPYEPTVTKKREFIHTDRDSLKKTPMIQYNLVVECKTCEVALKTNFDVPKFIPPFTDIPATSYGDIPGYRHLCDALNQR